VAGIKKETVGSRVYNYLLSLQSVAFYRKKRLNREEKRNINPVELKRKKGERERSAMASSEGLVEEQKTSPSRRGTKAGKRDMQARFDSGETKRSRI